MDNPTVPTTAPDAADSDRVAPCEPLGYRTPGRVTDKTRAEVYARDAMTCQGCLDGPLPRYGDLVSGPDGRLIVTPRYATLDHIIEQQIGGCHHAHNLRVLCQTCNPSLGNGGPGRAVR